MRILTRSLAAAAAATFALGALASPAVGTRNDGSRPIKLSATTELLGKSVPPGAYALKWTREKGSETVKLAVTRGKAVLAEGVGVWATAEQPYPHEALVYRNAGGASELYEIRFKGSADWIRVAKDVAPDLAGATSDGGR